MNGAALSYEEINAQGQAAQPEMSRIYRHLHAFPELSFEEHETSAYVAAELRALGLEPRTNVGKFGLVAEIAGTGESGVTGRPDAVVALRADIDALPIFEETDLPFASKKAGVMHACGHDGHTAGLLGAARILLANRHRFNGTVRLLFQAAEETTQGAKAMIADGVLDGVTEIYGLHNLPTLPAGYVAFKEGSLMGSVDILEIELTGKGGHGAVPQSARDPIVAAAALVMALQTAVSREMSPFEPAVVTIGSLHAGQVNNVIPGKAKLSGTVRTFSPEAKAKMRGILHRLIGKTAEAFGCTADIGYLDQVPVLVNDPACTAFAAAVADDLLGRERRLPAEPILAGEDFALYLERVPGCFLWLGSGPQENASEAFGLHHPKFRIHEECLSVGASVLAAIAIKRLQSL